MIDNRQFIEVVFVLFLVIIIVINFNALLILLKTAYDTENYVQFLLTLLSLSQKLMEHKIFSQKCTMVKTVMVICKYSHQLIKIKTLFKLM